MFTKVQLQMLHNAIMTYIADGDWQEDKITEIAELLTIIDKELENGQ